MQTHLITLTTDFGIADGSITLLKLAISKTLPNAAFTDINHQIKPLHIAHAAYLVENLYPHFPIDTLHLILANSLHHKDSELILIKKNGHFFLAPDNGVFNFLFRNESIEMYAVGKLHFNNNFYQNIANALENIFSKTIIGEMGTIYKDTTERLQQQLKIDETGIRGAVWLIDDFGNIITDIHRNQVNEIITGKKFAINFGYRENLTKIHQHIFEVDSHNPVAYFNQFGYLEIALRNYNISRIFNLKEGDLVKIEILND